jgi:hypothetical protein
MEENNESLGFKAAFPADLQKHEAFTDIKEVKDLGQRYVDLLGKSKDALYVPSADAKEEDKVAFQTKINGIRGVPEKPEMYELPIDPKAEGYNAELDKGIRQMFHEAGVDKTQAKKLLEQFVKMGGSLVPAQTEKVSKAAVAEFQASEQKRIDKVIADESAKLKTEWGGDYDKKVAVMGRAVENIEKVVPGFKKYAEDSGFGNNPFMVKVFAFIGEAISEDAFPKGGGGGSDTKQPEGQLNYTTM